jgi:ABC-type nickel/cobalt efflux system permease component RcnA
MTQSTGLKRGLLIALLVGLTLGELFFLITGAMSLLTDDEGMTFETALSLLFVMGIFGFPIWWAVRQLQSLPNAKPRNTDDQPLDLSHGTETPLFQFKVKIELAEYRKLLYFLTYTRPAIIFVHFLGLGMIMVAINKGEFDWFFYFFLLFILFIPISVYRTAISNYKSSKALHQPITYDITEDRRSTAP